MRTKLVRIGNSRGIRIPKPIIEQCGFGRTVALRVEDCCLVIAPGRLPRQGWEETLRAAGPAAADELLLQIVPRNQFDRDEWKW
jgi:antitoxin MazE